MRIDAPCGDTLREYSNREQLPILQCGYVARLDAAARVGRSIHSAEGWHAALHYCYEQIQVSRHLQIPRWLSWRAHGRRNPIASVDVGPSSAPRSALR